jgi:hypothetical protein
MGHRTITVAAAGLAVACAAGSMTATSRADADRVDVCVERLELNRQPNQGWDGVLHEGESIRVRKFSASGKYAYGFAYGDINRRGWVRTSGLCESDGAEASVRERLVGSRIAVCAPQLHLDRRPNAGWQGTLRRDDTFKVRKLSDSGRYAYGFAYGHINRLGWVDTEGLC